MKPNMACSRQRRRFFSREERRAHVHVQHADGEAKFWIEPVVELAANFSLKPKQVTEVQKLIEEHLDEIRGAWAKRLSADGGTPGDEEASTPPDAYKI